MNPASLLNIEDDDVARDIVAAFIAKRYVNLPVYSAGSAEAGLELFKKHRQTVVMTDINLTHSNGIWMARSIRSIVPDTAIIFVTGHSDVETLSEFEATGPCHVVTKPIKFRELYGILDRYIT